MTHITTTHGNNTLSLYRQYDNLHEFHHAINQTGYENPELVDLNASKLQHIPPFQNT
jgi:hypothetical protein